MYCQNRTQQTSMTINERSSTKAFTLRRQQKSQTITWAISWLFTMSRVTGTNNKQQVLPLFIVKPLSARVGEPRVMPEGLLSSAQFTQTVSFWQKGIGPDSCVRCVSLRGFCWQVVVVKLNWTWMNHISKQTSEAVVMTFWEKPLLIGQYSKTPFSHKGLHRAAYKMAAAKVNGSYHNTKGKKHKLKTWTDEKTKAHLP